MADGKAAPLPGLEQQLAAIWRRVLARDDLHRHAGFFALGGDSILAIQVVAQARAEGIALSPRDLFQYQTLATLAEAAAERAGPAMGQGPVTGAQSLTPIQSWFFARALPQAHHWNQAMVLAPARELDPGHLRAALRHLSDRHDALRARFHRGASGWQQVYDAPGRAPLLIESREPVTEAASALQAGFDLAQGPLWGAVLARGADGGQRLAVAAHHLIVDGVSWRVLLGDLQALYLALEAGEDPAQNPARRSTSPGAWADVLRDSPAIAAERPYWQAQTAPPAPRLPLDHPEGANDMAHGDRVDSRIDAGLSAQLLEAVPEAYPVTPQEVLLAALYLALRDWTGATALRLELESHGRPDLSDAVDLSRTVGWLTALFPLHLEVAAQSDGPAVLRRVKDSLRAVPHDGVGYGVLRHLHGAAMGETAAQVRFNYLGRAGAIFADDSLLRPAAESAGPSIGAANPRDRVLEINALADDAGLRLGWNFSRGQLNRATVETLAARFTHHLQQLVSHCLHGTDAGFTPSDFPEMDFAQDDLDALLDSL